MYNIRNCPQCGRDDWEDFKNDDGEDCLQCMICGYVTYRG